MSDNSDARYYQVLIDFKEGDIDDIARRLDLTLKQVTLLRHYVFAQPNMRWQCGRTRTIYSCHEIADAWLRLTSGEFTNLDVYLFKGIWYEIEEIVRGDRGHRIER